MAKHILFHKTTRIKVDEKKLSTPVKIKEGEPQVVAISSTIFLAYINAIVCSLPRHISNILHIYDLAVWYADTSTAIAILRI